MTAGTDTFIRTEERRAFRRWPVALEAACDTGLRNLKGKIVEISEAGLAFQTDSPLPVGSEIVLEYGLNTKSEPIKVTGLVRQNTRHIKGVQFLNLKMNDRLRILNHVTRAASG